MVICRGGAVGVGRIPREGAVGVGRMPIVPAPLQCEASLAACWLAWAAAMAAETEVGGPRAWSRRPDALSRGRCWGKAEKRVQLKWLLLFCRCVVHVYVVCVCVL